MGVKASQKGGGLIRRGVHCGVGYSYHKRADPSKRYGGRGHDINRAKTGQATLSHMDRWTCRGSRGVGGARSGVTLPARPARSPGLEAASEHCEILS